MFETSHVRARVAAQRRYGFLTVSLAVHTAVIAAVLVASVSSLSLPARAPRELPAFANVIPVVIPPPHGTRTAPRGAAQVPAQQPPARPAPHVDAAPSRIPEAIAPVGPATGDSSAPAGNPTAGYGDPNGVPGGVDTGEPPPVATTTAPPPEVYRAGGEVRSPVVLRRIEPVYPRVALNSRLAGVVVLECIVDKEGRIRDAHVVSSTMSIFNKPALDALQQWKFAPGVFRGRAVDTWFELTVAFRLR